MTLQTPKRIVVGLDHRDHAEFSRIYVRCLPNLLALVRRMTQGSPDAPDIVQDSFDRLLRHPGRFRSLDKVKHFLMNTARNICVDRRRHREVVERKSGDIAYHLQSVEPKSAESAEVMALVEEKMYELIQKLPKRTRKVHELYYFKQLSNAEIAQRLGMPEKSVANRKSEAMQWLTPKLKKVKHQFYLFLCC
ncbi:MAG TPA: sigma-70 family RNA polymerase sigma factor [Puia sp.]|nr:sigma-70 family RNA polymerase sigma factor [Puia sp.]